MQRSSHCGELTARDIGKTETLAGWVHSRRDHGGVLFCDLRDRTGLVQIVFRPERAELFRKAQDLGNEDVLQVSGRVTERPGGTRNPNIPTGDVEIDVESLEVLNRSKPPPFEI